jgi:hypothetical protein
MNFQVIKQMNSSGRQMYNVVDSNGKRADSFTTQEAADTRAAAMNAEYERVLAVL